MPRGRATTAPKKTTTASSPKEDKAKKIEPQEFASCASTSNKSPNLYSGKFEKKKRPRIKIQYEDDSPVKQEQESESVWEPPHWQDFLLNLRTMTANGDAPVDTMGCHMSSDPDASPQVIRYQLLISLMLSTHTKDRVTNAAMDRLRERGLTIDNVLSMSDSDLGNLIYPVLFWRLKAKYIKKTSKILKEQYDGDIPNSVEELCKLPGVGPKTAHMCMKAAWNKVTGIGVDSHVHRISNRIGWVKQPTATKEDTRKALEDWLPLELWGEVNHSLIGFGQRICLPLVPNCEECLNKDICPSRVIKSPKKKMPTKGKVTIHKLNVPNARVRKISPTKEIKNEGNNSQDNLKVPFDSTSNSDIKVQRKRKVTPKKAVVEQAVTEDGDENLVAVSNSETSQQRKRRVTPKRTALKQAVTNASEENLFVSDSNYVQQRKRKVSPKKPVEQEPTDVNTVEDCLIVLDSSDEEEEPRRRRVTPVKESKQDDKGTNKLASKALPKRKITPKKTQLQQHDDDFVQPVLLEVNSNLQIVVNSPVKRRSPRVRRNTDEKPVSNRSGRNKTKTS